MKNNNIKQYVARYVAGYGINDERRCFRGEVESIADVIKSGKIENYLDDLSMVLGLTRDELQGCDKTALNKYMKKYPFFGLMSDFNLAENLFRNAMTFRIGDKNRAVTLDYNEARRRDVQERLLAYLKEREVYFPGIYHENASIILRSISTDYVIDFPELKELLASYVSIVDKAKELFWKIVCKKISEEEKREFNFLVTALALEDAATGSPMYSYWIEKTLDIIIEEGFDDFYDYVRVDPFMNFAPWRCLQFVEDKKLAQEYVDIFPNSKQHLLDYFKGIKCLSCTYNWSDDPENPYANMNEEELLDSMCKEYSSDEDLDIELPNYAPKNVLLPKTEAELGQDGAYANSLEKFCVVSSRGGLKAPKREHRFDVSRMILRASVLKDEKAEG